MRMKHAALAVAVAIALFAAFVCGVNYDREVRIGAMAEARIEAAVASQHYGDEYTPAYSSSYASEYDSGDAGDKPVK